jgi:hypothetical protein
MENVEKLKKEGNKDLVPQMFKKGKKCVDIIRSFCTPFVG